jgi:hypothetical protein
LNLERQSGMSRDAVSCQAICHRLCATSGSHCTRIILLQCAPSYADLGEPILYAAKGARRVKVPNFWLSTITGGKSHDH